MFLDKNKVEDLILELDLVSPEDFALAEQEAGEKDVETWQILLRKGLLNENDFRTIQMKAMGVPFIDLNTVKIVPDVLTIIPEPIVRQYNLIAFDRDERNLKVAVLDLGDLEKIDFLKKKISLRIIPYLTNRTSLNNAILQYQDLLKNEYGQSIQKGFSSFQTIAEEALKDLPREQLLELSRSKQVNNVFYLLLRHALLQKVSNIHIEPQEESVLVRYRINGDLYPAMVLPKKSAVILSLKIKTMAQLRFDITNLPQSGRFPLGFDGQEVDFRVHTLPSFWGEKIVLNILQTGDAGFSLEAVGFHGEALDLLHSVLSKKEKMFLIAGQPHSGRTTTFYTFLDLLKNPHLNISTVEDSVGFQMTGINQMVTLPAVGFDVLPAVGQLAKQDCDVIAVDEVSELSLNKLGKVFAKLAEVAETDRFVPVVFETNLSSTTEILSKLADLDKANCSSILNSLGGIILQKLIPELSGERQEYYLSVSEIKKMSKTADLEKVMSALVEENVLAKEKPWSEVKFFKSVNGKSSPPKADAQNGQIMVSEVLKISSLIRSLVKEKTFSEKIEKARGASFLTLKEDILFKAVQGLVSVEELLPC